VPKPLPSGQRLLKGYHYKNAFKKAFCTLSRGMNLFFLNHAFATILATITIKVAALARINMPRYVQRSLSIADSNSVSIGVG
jgi:hypothetical protein